MLFAGLLIRELTSTIFSFICLALAIASLVRIKHKLFFVWSMVRSLISAFEQYVIMFEVALMQVQAEALLSFVATLIFLTFVQCWYTYP